MLLGVGARRSYGARAVVSCYGFAKKGENWYGRGKGEIERGQAGEREGEAELLAVLWSWEIKFGNQGLSRTKYST